MFERPCPVAALADEMRRHVEIDERLDALRFRAEAQSERDRLERLNDINLKFFREGVRDRAIFLRTQSAKGALLQLCLINERIDALHELTTVENDTKATEAVEAAQRLLYSVIGFIESISDARVADTGGQYFLNPELSPFALLDDAAAQVEQAEKRSQIK